MNKTVKIIIGVIILLLVVWFFDFSTWVQSNIEGIILVMVSAVLGGFWWLRDEIEEIKEILRDIQNRS